MRGAANLIFAQSPFHPIHPHSFLYPRLPFPIASLNPLSSFPLHCLLDCPPTDREILPCLPSFSPPYRLLPRVLFTLLNVAPLLLSPPRERLRPQSRQPPSTDRMRRQNRSCDQCRKAKRACDAPSLWDIQRNSDRLRSGDGSSGVSLAEEHLGECFDPASCCFELRALLGEATLTGSEKPRRRDRLPRPSMFLLPANPKTMHLQLGSKPAPDRSCGHCRRQRPDRCQRSSRP